MEIINIPEEVRAAMYKVASINLCSNVNGQICTAMVMNPPKVSRPFQPDTFVRSLDFKRLLGPTMTV